MAKPPSYLVKGFTSSILPIPAVAESSSRLVTGNTIFPSLIPEMESSSCLVTGITGFLSQIPEMESSSPSVVEKQILAKESS